jgi:energy-coupling factor transport system substrate-specific component
VSWQAVTLAGLGLALVGGFAWYERSRPTARLVALVAALAALAVAGRLVLAPIPNLVATTDVALITGYALGAAPGFAVGALAAPISNIWLGQGPWTAWQMAGWGMVGLAGAALAVLTRRRMGRLGLALACGLAGFAYGALLDLSVMVGYGGEQSLDRYLAISARSLPFNVVHAAGNFAIALAAGPALVRMISRYRTRMRFTWRPAAAAPLILLALLALPWQAPAAEAQSDASRAVSWLVSTQNADGGFGATAGYPSNPSMTGWVVLGLEGGGRNPLDVRRGGETPISYLRSQISRLRSDGDLERTILALRGAGLEPRRFAGKDLVASLRRYRDGDGSIDGQVNRTAFYVIAMRAAGVDAGALARSARWLRRGQSRDGGWGVQPGAPSDPDSTGAALQALAAAGSGGRTSVRGVRYLRRAQRGSGGFALAGSGVVNSQSTAWAVQGLVAAGGGGSTVAKAIAYLNRQRASDGHYRYSPSSDQTPIWVTAQVLLAIERRPLPLAAAPRRERGTKEGAGTGSDEQTAPPASGGAGSSPASTGAGAATPSGSGGSGASASNGENAAGAPADAAASGGGAPTQSSGSTTASTTPTSESEAAPTGVTVAANASERADEGSDDALYAIGAATAALAAAAGGLAWYRRRRA